MVRPRVCRSYLLEVVRCYLFYRYKLLEVSGIRTLHSVKRLVIAHVAGQGAEETNVSSQCMDHEKRSTPGATLDAHKSVQVRNIAFIDHLDQVPNGGLAEEG